MLLKKVKKFLNLYKRNESAMKNKINKNVNDNKFFYNFLKSIPEQTKRSARISMDIASQINSILKQKNISQRELASRLNKKESEISKWLSGNHNFTIKTLA
jgi:ribosome-binding protein aMBF1 (putative translation factor)